MEKVDTMKLNKFFFIIIFFTLNTLLFPISLSTIKGLNRLSNYNEIKDINVDNIVSSDEIERINGIVVYVKNNKIFNGVLIARKNGQNITGIYFYENGKNYGIANSYYENGQLYLTGNYVNDKIEGKSFEYYLNGKLKDERFYKNGIIINSMEYYENGRKKRIFKTTEGLRGIIDFYVEYFDNSEQKKLDCKELASNNWRCKEYKKNGELKREFDSPTFSEAKDWSFGINFLLGILNILF